MLDVGRVMTSVEKMLVRVIGEQIELEVFQPVAPVFILADPSQVEVVLLNLAVNARDAMPRGGRLVVETDIVELADGAAGLGPGAEPGPYVCITVRDSGDGMTHEIRSRVFEPFFSTKGPGRGTGLGLATVYGIVTQSDGFITVSSEPGNGSSFGIHLPLVSGPEDFQPVAASMEDLPPGTGTVLIVEDQWFVRSMIRDLLQGRGYTVVEASNGEEALEVATAASIDLLLTDVVMPGMGGVEPAGRLRANGRGGRVLFMSGFTNDSLSEDGRLADGVSLIRKPFEAAELLTRVAAELARDG